MTIEQGASLPCVVQVGFAGSRDLFGVKDLTKVAELERKTVELLGGELEGLRKEFGLTDRHFFCGVSQIAIGADMVFAEACAKRADFLQRIFLPQHREHYLGAIDSDNTADFSENEQKRARDLLAGSQIIEETVVARSDDRHERFEEVNLEIARASDLVICLTRKLSDAERAEKLKKATNGGTDDLLGRALARGLTTLELEVEVIEGDVVAWSKRVWHNQARLKDPKLPTYPALPEELRSATVEVDIPDVSRFCGAMQPLTGDMAERWKGWFDLTAAIVVGTHVAASLLAVGLLVFHDQLSHRCISWLLPWFVGAELLLLLSGFIAHLALHRSHAGRQWAFNRLVAELNRSVEGVSGLHMSLNYFFDVELPQRLRPLLRTLNVLHLKSSRQADRGNWKPVRDTYLARVAVQQEYYGKNAPMHERKAKRNNWLFLLFSGAAIATGVYKFATHGLHLGEAEAGSLAGVLEIIGIVGPILAVGILSYSSAMDHEANGETFKETKARIDDLARQITAAKSRNELERLVVETERVLLGENAAWFSRRTFKGVS